ncbi:ABC transporter permease [Paractinoplanes brasiliensis]|uniref:ABC-type proline/glycine betaine transport system permease subunit n=1 Tax=Paractinoplanes brasiliensis TaxID=52695 RepID=A0A4R6JWH1_9ACTN|nr:ABC transporter permease subunit [Actinoplanes brasiliensis]TDO41029.1 ABC-type proline/glycine betaine transport system permease subunit [Actinoplanes brasiliensis]GID26097.1 hypothetical protein Abr02nite_10800 [Actinoplanes brasiliensis]
MTTTAPPPAVQGRVVEPVTDRAHPARRSGWVPTRTVGAVLAVATVAAYLLFRTDGAADGDDAAAFRFFDSVRDWVDANRDSSPFFLYGVNYVRLGVRLLVDGVQAVLYGLGFAGLVTAVTAIGLVLAGWRTGLLALLGFLAFGVLGLWQESVDTLVLTLSAVLLSVLIGVPLGVLAARVRWVGASLRPVLDVMQIMPTFAYLAPMTLLFLIGEPAAVIATMIYAVPATIRITALGISEVSPTAVEAATALGSTRRQLLTKVRLPMARTTIVLAVNQTIMLALSMVVITALIDAPGLGQNIVNALQRVNVGAAFDAGVAIVILAVVLDRITTNAARRTGGAGGWRGRGIGAAQRVRNRWRGWGVAAARRVGDGRRGVDAARRVGGAGGGPGASAVRELRTHGWLRQRRWLWAGAGALILVAVNAKRTTINGDESGVLGVGVAGLGGGSVAAPGDGVAGPNWFGVGGGEPGWFGSFSFAGPVNDVVGWIELHWYGFTEGVKNGVSAGLLDPLETLLVTTPWWLFVLVVAAFGTLWSVGGGPL